jgi:transcriptional regulator with XRE-family HTH domain
VAATEPAGSEPASFGELLREYRELAGLSQEALSARSGVSSDTISQWERGVVRQPRRSTLKLLADALGLDATARNALVAATSRPLPEAVPAYDAVSAGEIPPPAAEVAEGRKLPFRTPLVMGASVLLAAVVAAAAVLYETGRLAPPLEVGSVDIRAVPSDLAHCPAATVVVEGTIAIRAGEGTIVYHWVHPDGKQGPDTFVHVPAGAQAVHVSLRLDYTGTQAGQGAALLAVSAPERVSSDPLTLSYMCP